MNVQELREETDLNTRTGATRTFVFDHTIRRPSKIPPTHSVHVDQSYESALSRVTYHLPEDAERLLKGRVQLINVWRPIKTIRRDPLGVSQCQSTHEDDLVPITVVYPHGDRTGATLAVKYNESQKWYFKWHQTPDEALLLRCFDNRAGPQSAERYRDRAKRVPHTAFEIPGTEQEEPRESIEVRCLVFHEYDVEED